MSIDRYTSLLSENLKFMVKEEITDIFKFMLRHSSLTKYDFFCGFPSLFGKAVAHFEKNEPCATEGCKPVPDPREDEEENPQADLPPPSHILFVKQKIQCFTAMDLMIEEDLDYVENGLVIPMSDVDYGVARMLAGTQEPYFKELVDDCIRVGRSIVGL